jgi:hypothetical protein
MSARSSAGFTGFMKRWWRFAVPGLRPEGAVTLYRENNRPEPDEHGPIYMAIERALWALGPALLLFILVGHLSTQTARQQADADLAMEIAGDSPKQSRAREWGTLHGVTRPAF